MRQRERAGLQVADVRETGDRAAAYRMAVLIAQSSSNMLAPAGWEVIALCDHLCADPRSTRNDGRSKLIAKDVRS